MSPARMLPLRAEPAESAVPVRATVSAADRLTALFQQHLAELVRIETLARRGDAAAARERAHAFFVRFPQSPLGKRLRSLVDRLPPPSKESP